jgi:hypothetical protein
MRPTDGRSLPGGIFAFISFFALGPGVCVWLALSELMPTRIRSNGMSIALMLNQFVSTVLAAVFLPVVSTYGYSVMFVIFAVSPWCICAWCCSRCRRQRARRSKRSKRTSSGPADTQEKEFPLAFFTPIAACWPGTYRGFDDRACGSSRRSSFRRCSPCCAVAGCEC